MSKYDYEDLGDCDDDYVAELHARYEIKDVGERGVSITRYQVPEEFQDYLQVMEMGARKHGADNWLNPNGSKSSFKQMHDSMFHHLAESFAAGNFPEDSFKRQDHESGLDPLLHLICRAQMLYTRLKRGIRHEQDL